MARPKPATGKRPLSRGWYVVALIIAIGGWTAMALFLAARLGGSTDGMIRVLVPGETELRLNEAGRYVIYHEFRSAFEGRVYHVDAVSGLNVTVRSGVSGAVVPLEQTTATSYTVGSRSGRSLFAFDVAAPGPYLIAGAYSDGRRDPQTVLAIDRGFVRDLLLTIFGALAMAFGGTALAVAIVGAVFFQRRRVRRTAG
jgi:hypothetical protein